MLRTPSHQYQVILPLKLTQPLKVNERLDILLDDADADPIEARGLRVVYFKPTATPDAVEVKIIGSKKRLGAYLDATLEPVAAEDAFWNKIDRFTAQDYPK